MTARQRRRVGFFPWNETAPRVSLEDVLKPPAWHAYALCGEAGGDGWFPEDGEHPGIAKRVCYGCPVRGECLNDALDRGDRHGIWGGYSPKERQEILRQRKAGAA